MFPYRHLLLICALLLASQAQARPSRNPAQPGQFDYYTVAHSWSPAYCATARKDSEQCDSGRQLGFVQHGLWPQYEKGYPQNCSTERLPEQARAKFAPLYPSASLVAHEWSKHGTCSGLDPAAYFALSGKLKEQLVIPAPFVRPREPVRTNYNDMVKAFRRANPGMPINSVLPFCGGGGRFLREVHACYTRNGEPRACSSGQVKRSFNSCRLNDFLVQSVR
jgi:ribonuclease T2